MRNHIPEYKPQIAPTNVGTMIADATRHDGTI
jgi:hypothetical protein